MKIKAWYFASKNNRLRYGDNRLVRAGIKHSVEGDPITCHHGLHASEQIIDALYYAETSIAYRVELTGKMDFDEDKIAAQSRYYIKRFDLNSILFEFSRKQALINIEVIKPYCSSDNYDLIYKYLNTGAKSIKSATGVAAWSAADSTSSMVAQSAALMVARLATLSIARSTALLVAQLAVGTPARSAANKILIEMIEDKYGKIEE